MRRGAKEMTATTIMAKGARPQEPFFGYPAMAMNEYVRKDVFAARMDRLHEATAPRSDIADLPDAAKPTAPREPGSLASMEALLAQTLAEIRLDNVKLRSELKDEMKSRHAELKDDIKAVQGELKDDINELRGDIRVINARLDTQQTKFGWYLAVFGLVITVAVAAIQLWK